jgi:hypothetical protein
LRAAVAVAPDGVLRAGAAVASVTLQDVAAGGASSELLALDAAHVSGLTVDPAGARVRVEAVDLSGPRLAARRDADGSLAAVGLRSKLRAPTKSLATVRSATRPAATSLAASENTTPTEPPTSPASAPPPPRLELGRLTWKGVDVQFVDQAVSPATNVRLNNTGVELANIVIDLDDRGGAAASAAATGTVRAWLTAPGVAEALTVEGTVAPRAGAVSADLTVSGKGLRGEPLAPYLKDLGIEPALRNGSLQLRTRVALAQRANDAIAASLAVENLRYADGEAELIGMDRLAVDEVQLTRDGVAVASIQIDKPRARAQRNADGSLSVAGVRMNVASTQPATEEARAAVASAPARVAPQGAPSPSAPQAVAPFVAKFAKLRVNDASLTWGDQAVSPAVNATGRANVELDGFVVGADPAPPASLKLVAKLDQTLEQFSAAGTLSPSATAPMVKLNLAGTGMREGVLAPYLPPGMNVALKDGRFRAVLEAAVAPHAQGGQSARLVVSDVDYRDGEGGQPLLAFDLARVLVSRADVPGKVIAIDEVSLSALQTEARKAADGSLHVLGVKLGATPPPRVAGATTAPRASSAPAAPSAQPVGALVLLRVHLLEPRRRPCDLGGRALHGHARPEPSDDVEEVVGAVGEEILGQEEWNPRFSIARRERERRGHHTDHRVWLPVELDA